MADSTNLRDFLQLFDKPTPLAVLAVKAPVGFVTGSLADTYELRQLVESGPIRELEGVPSCGRWVSVTQMVDDPWTYVVWASGVVAPETQAGLGLFAEDLSETLGAEAVTMVLSVPDMLEVAEDFSGPVSGICVYLQGEVAERAVVSSSDELLVYDSAEERDAPESGAGLLESMLEALEISLPLGVPDSDGEDGWLAVSGIDPETIARTDLVEASLRLPTEEETLDMVLEEGEDGEPRAVALARAQETEAPAEPEAEPAEEEALDEDDTHLIIPTRESGSDDGPSESPKLGLVGRLTRWFGKLGS